MNHRTRFSRLFEPGKIGKMEVKNRIVMPAMSSTTHATVDGFASQLTRQCYEARARGGVGLIVVGSLCVDFPVGVSGRPRLTIHDDQYIPALNQVVQVIHKHGAKAIAQLHHAGNAAVTAPPPVAPSAILRHACYVRPMYFLPRELTTEEIPQIVERFAQAAARAQQAGFDGVEIHAAHRYLINEFLSPYWNRRTDRYGGSLENRVRFLQEIAAAVRKTVGPDFPMLCRINGAEFDIEGGITLDEAKQIAQFAEKAGVDCMHVSALGVAGEVASPVDAPGFGIALPAEIKKGLGIPVIAVGRISPELGEKVLRQNKADFIAIGRALLADPDLPNKAYYGKMDDITPCIGCSSCHAAPKVAVSPDLLEPGQGDAGRECAVNAGLIREYYVVDPAPTRKKVVVVGGGIGGMEAARVAALRGHEVTLFEKEASLGGLVLMASLLRAEYENLVTYLSHQVQKLGVRVELRKEATPDRVAALKPDAIVVATGASMSLPQIPGIERENVLSSAALLETMLGHSNGAGRKIQNQFMWRAGGGLLKHAQGRSLMRSAMKFWVPLNGSVLIVGRGLAGIELADFLVERGKRVTIVDTREDLPFGEPPMAILRQYLEWKLGGKGVATIVAREYESINDHGLNIINKKGQSQTIEGDTIIFATGYEPNLKVAKALGGISASMQTVGDCAEPCGILEAIRSGNQAGRDL